jgi:heat shock protein HtpX
MTIGRSGVLAVCLVALVVAGAAIVVIASGAGGLVRSVVEGRLADRLPWAAFAIILILPVLAFALAALGARRAAGGTFTVQATANRRNSLLLLVTLVGVVAATAEVIAVAVTFQPVPALWAAGLAAIVGLGAAFCADRFGGDIVLRTANARPADPTRDQVLVNVVQELSLAAAIPAPQVFVIEDGSQNAFATGRDPAHASVAVTRGLLDRLDREQLQGVIGHELGHVRNLDTRYSLYVAVLVGLVALVTDGFLRTVLEGWRQGAFLWGGDADDIKGAIAAFASGLVVGLFLLAVAVLLRIVAPLFAAMVQAATSREREFLADTSSVELTRNPRGLERALVAIATDTDPLEAGNRGTQHLWFRNPVKPGDDGRPGILATHPSLGARIARLRRLQGLGPLDPATTSDDVR